MQTTKAICLLVLALTTPAITHAASAKFTPEDLYDQLSRDLTKQLPKSFAEPSKRAAGIISGNPECNLSQDKNSLQSHLLTAFKQSPDLNWNQNQTALSHVAESVSLAMFGGAEPLATPDKLAKALANSLAHHLKSLNHDTIARESGSIAQACSNANSRNNLSEALEQQLWHNTSLGLERDTAARMAIASETVQSISPSEVWTTRLVLKDNESGNPWQFTIWGGARLDNPYQIKIADGVAHIQTADSSSDGYIEFSINNRYVIRGGGTADLIIWGTQPTKPNGIPHFFWPFDRFPDVDGRVGYTFRGKSASTNFNVSTVVGGSDIYGDTSVGFPFAQVAGPEYAWKSQLTLEFGGGVATEKERLDVHPNFFAGLGSQTSFTAIGLNSSNYKGFWLSRLGLALIDEPSIVSGTNIVRMNSLGQPEYDLKWVPAIGTIVVYPLTSTFSLQAGFNTYFTQTPPSIWNVNVGLTVNIEQMFGALGRKDTSGPSGN